MMMMVIMMKYSKDEEWRANAKTALVERREVEPFILALTLPALNLPCRGRDDCHFRSWTQSVMFETFDQSGAQTKKNREFNIVMSGQFHTLAMLSSNRLQDTGGLCSFVSLFLLIFHIWYFSGGSCVFMSGLQLAFLPVRKTSQLERSSVRACGTDLSFHFYFFY